METHPPVHNMPPAHGGSTLNQGRLLSDTARLHPDGLALARGDARLTWRALDERVNALVAGLAGLGLGQGDPIMLHAPNSLAYVEAFFAILKLGAVLVPTNHRLTPPEVAYVAELCGVRAIIHDSASQAHVNAAKTAVSGLTHAIALDGPEDAPNGQQGLISANLGAIGFEAPVQRDDAAWYFCTSGTTGRPKAAVLTHGQMAYIVTNHLADLMPGISAVDRALVIAPLSHGAGIHLLVTTARGCASILTESPGFDPGEALRLMEAHRVSNLFTVPTLVNLLVDHPERPQRRLDALRWMIYAGAPMYREDQKRALEALGPVLVQYYGLAEVTGNITVLPPNMHDVDDARMPVGSCGYPRVGMEIAIRAPDGAMVPVGEQGEVCVRGAGVFAGYLNNPEANRESFREGWFHTGDLGRVDARGLLYLTGRAKDMFISGGSNIYPREIEEVLLEHPAVEEVAVLGMPHPKWGETGVAVVVASGGAGIATDALEALLDGRLARYKWPKRYVFWDALPKSGYGKVPKHIIRQKLLEDWNEASS